MGRGAVKVEGISDVLAQLLRVATPVAAALRSYRGTCRSGPPCKGDAGHPGAVIGSMPADMLPLAKCIEPSRLSFFGSPSFDPLPFLDPVNRAWYADPVALSEEAFRLGSHPPKVRVRCALEEHMRFFKLLDDGGRLALHPVSALREGYGAGAFAIPKSVAKDRLIVDCRPANQLEPDKDRWIRSLGSIFQLRTLFLRPGFQLITFAEDIRDFYCGFKVPEPRELRNFFEGKFVGSQFNGFKCYRLELADCSVCPCLSTLAMGDKRAVAYGQAAHLSVALRGGACDLSEFITLKAGVPRSGDFCGLMIDDFVHCAQVPLSDDGSAAPSWQRTQAEGNMHALRQAYEDSGLPRHPDKAVWGLPDAEVLERPLRPKKKVEPSFLC